MKIIFIFHVHDNYAINLTIFMLIFYKIVPVSFNVYTFARGRGYFAKYIHSSISYPHVQTEINGQRTSPRSPLISLGYAFPIEIKWKHSIAFTINLKAVLFFWILFPIPFSPFSGGHHPNRPTPSTAIECVYLYINIDFILFIFGLTILHIILLRIVYT